MMTESIFDRAMDHLTPPDGFSVAVMISRLTEGYLDRYRNEAGLAFRHEAIY